MIINLETLEGLPIYFIQKLTKFDDLLLKFDFLEEIEDLKTVEELIIEFQEFLNNQIIIGYHYTRALENNILKEGLLSRNGEEIRSKFIKDFSHEFTEGEISLIKELWRNCFDDSDKEVRDNRIYFNFTKNALKNSGARLLLNNYGGEQVYWPLYNVNEISSKLKSLGTPMILECKLEAKKINTFSINPWAKIAISSYHKKINPNAHTEDRDAYINDSVTPKNIKIISLH
ncbi:hypothetical protein BC962_3260 [Gillisia mitskevichiae]|uniref:Uncharacterized protein n=1 Tax=Gillisia mitskevichiae TaxID=270921 RepID=A0A495NZC5_9FLAO|nr:hypothetical protein [Gillisia mitskevichiae]RKS42502.1 hypothetical protein BC962_3260 [Gillisia mitskevichiae]